MVNITRSMCVGSCVSGMVVVELKVAGWLLL